MSARPGKVLEAELRQFFRSAQAWSHGFDNVGATEHRCPRCSQPVRRLNAQRPGDRIGCYRGLSVLVECKETGVPRLPWDALQEHQARNLRRHAESGGVSLVVIRWNIPRKPRAFLVPWPVWTTLERELSRASLPLQDGARPEQLLELARGRLSPHDAGPTWDLTEYLDDVVERRSRP